MKRDYIGEVIAEDAAARGNACAPIARYKGCSIQQKEADRKLRAELMVEFGTAYPHVDCSDMADRAMRVIKGVR